MKNIRLYTTKIIKPLSDNWKEVSRKNTMGINVIVLDLQTNKSVKFVSITEAARSLAAHPSTIWKRVHDERPYLERYLIKKDLGKDSAIYLNKINKPNKIIESNKTIESNKIIESNKPNVINKLIKTKANKIKPIKINKPKQINKNDKHSSHLINYSVLLYILLISMLCGYMIYKYIPYISVLYSGIYNYFNPDYLYNVSEKDKLINNIFNNIKNPITNKVNGLAEFNEEWRSIDLLKNKPFFKGNFIHISQVGIHQFVSNEITLNTQVGPNTITTLSHGYSPVTYISSPLSVWSHQPSPVINRFSSYGLWSDPFSPLSRTNIDNVFSNAIASTKLAVNTSSTITNTHNSLVLHPQSLFNNRNYSIIDTALYGPRSPGKELLNYNSNVLYCIINGIPTPTPIYK